MPLSAAINALLQIFSRAVQSLLSGVDGVQTGEQSS